ncbi:MAG: hypothetical protein Q9M27_06625, partial [Mariprofundaceae bacterium]|nr:hypothetical protein [Mariprofundaceae bacterium]
HTDNWMVDDHHHVHLIDNGLSLPDDDSSPDYWKNAHASIYKVAKNAHVPQLHADKDALRKSLQGMSPQAVDGVLQRLQAVNDAQGKRFRDIEYQGKKLNRLIWKMGK